MEIIKIYDSESEDVDLEEKEESLITKKYQMRIWMKI